MVVIVVMAIAAVSAGPVQAGSDADKSDFASVNGRAVATGVRPMADVPGFLPISPLADVGVGWALAEMNIAQNHAQASPVFPGDVVLGLPGVLALLGLPLPVTYPLVAESFDPPGQKAGGQVPDVEVSGVVSLRALHNNSEAGASSASAGSAVGEADLAGGLVGLGGVQTSSQIVLAEGGPRVEAEAAVARVVVAGLLELGGLTASASDHATSQATGKLAVASCMIADVRCEVTPDGVVITDTNVPAPIAAIANQALARLAEQGFDVRLGEVSADDDGVRAAAVVVQASVPIEPPAAAGVPQQTVDVTFEIGSVSASSSAVALEPFEPAPSEPIEAVGSGASASPVGGDDASAVPSPGTSDGTSEEPAVVSPSPTGEPEIAAPQPASETPAQILIGRVARMPDGLLLLFGALVVVGSLGLVFVPRRSILP